MTGWGGMTVSLSGFVLSKLPLKNNLQKALHYGYEALQQARQRDTRLTLRDAYQLLYLTYDRMNKPDSAYAYYKKYVTEKGAIVLEQYKGKLYAYQQESLLTCFSYVSIISKVTSLHLVGKHKK